MNVRIMLPDDWCYSVTSYPSNWKSEREGNINSVFRSIDAFKDKQKICLDFQNL